MVLNILVDRYAKMLDDIIVQSIGAIDDMIITSAHNPFSSASMFFSGPNGSGQNGTFALASTPTVALQ